MIIAVDVGGTKTLVGSFQGERQVVNEERFPTPHDERAFLRQLQATLQHFDANNAQAICIAVPGIINRDGTVLRCANLPWVNFPLQKLLTAAFGCPIFINNDARLAGLAEANSLPEIPPLCVYVTVSTGIGTGIITHGRLDPALANSEGGHMILQTSGGFRGWETFASGHAIRDEFGKLAADIHDQTDWQIIVDELAIGFQALIPLLQPDVIVIGGSVGMYFERFGSLLVETLTHRLTSYIDVPQIVQAKHPDEAVVYGCYYYATHQGTDSTASR